VFVAAPICGNVIIWDVFEIKDGLSSKAMLPFDNDCPKDAAESLFGSSASLYEGEWKSQIIPSYLDFSPI
jgi:hypothetical protein